MTAAMAARERALAVLADQEQTDIDASRLKYGHKLIMYGSTQTHSLGAKVRTFRTLAGLFR